MSVTVSEEERKRQSSDDEWVTVHRSVIRRKQSRQPNLECSTGSNSDITDISSDAVKDREYTVDHMSYRDKSEFYRWRRKYEYYLRYIFNNFILTGYTKTERTYEEFEVFAFRQDS